MQVYVTVCTIVPAKGVAYLYYYEHPRRVQECVGDGSRCLICGWLGVVVVDTRYGVSQPVASRRLNAVCCCYSRLTTRQ